MADERGHERERVAAAMRRINHAWRTGRVDDLTPLVHADVVMAVPAASARAQGRQLFLAGFRDFCEHATIADYREHDAQTDVVGTAGVATFRYEMVYERDGARYRATGRDLWVFALIDGEWIAVWRAMLDMDEQPA